MMLDLKLGFLNCQISSGKLIRMNQAFRNYRQFILIVVAIFGLVTLGILPVDMPPENLWYQALTKPHLQPPAWAFPLVWNTLYLLMCISLQRFLTTAKPPKKRIGFLLFAGQFLINVCWSYVFFSLHDLDLALLMIVVMFLFTCACTTIFWQVDKWAAKLLLPYLLWLGFAAYLTKQIIVLN